jgi:hypothetical protein
MATGPYAAGGARNAAQSLSEILSSVAATVSPGKELAVRLN